MFDVMRIMMCLLVMPVLVMVVVLVVQVVVSTVFAKAVSLLSMRVCHMSGTILTVLLVSRVAVCLLVAKMLVVMASMKKRRIVSAASHMI